MRPLITALPLLLSLPVAAAQNDPAAAVAALDNPAAVLIDVRTAQEFSAGALPGAKRIGYEQIAAQISALAPDKNTPIVLYCRSGRRSGIARDSLADLGYRNLINAGGYEQLKRALEQRD